MKNTYIHFHKDLIKRIINIMHEITALIYSDHQDIDLIKKKKKNSPNNYKFTIISEQIAYFIHVYNLHILQV